MRAATVKIHEAKEPKFLGPSSGIAITRLVMELAKQFADAKSITDIIPERQARQIKELYNEEQAKPTSKVYPLISDVAACDLPNRQLVDRLVELYALKVQPLYPAMHEPTLRRDIDAIFNPNVEPSDYQHFVCRMVIAISLQKMDTQYAGLADSYYLAALKYLEPVVKVMDLQTLQCFALMAEYSLLTPTRTAIYYVVGLAVRLAQALGYHEERTIIKGRGDQPANPLEIDMRRRLFWCVLVMDLGLSHSLGRPSIFATKQEHFNVEWFETCNDEDITAMGISPRAKRPTLKKWIAIHFFKMRLLQLEIRRKLYQRKRDEPRSDTDPWFVQMEAKLQAWRDAAPSHDGGHGLDSGWFTARYNTIVVFLFRPSPQNPRPSLSSAKKCFDACEYNIYMQREQIHRKNVDLTWIFTQSIFMAINTMLWTLSYQEIRQDHSREQVEMHLKVAMEAIGLASERWPGVASAVRLYESLITAVMRIYEKDGDVPISAVSPPSETASPFGFPMPDTHRPQTSPATVASSSVATPPERIVQTGSFAHDPQARQVPQRAGPSSHSSSYTRAPMPAQHPKQDVPFGHQQPFQPHQASDAYTLFNPLPEFTLEALTTVPNWSGPGSVHMRYGVNQPSIPTELYGHGLYDPANTAYPFPSLNPNPSNDPWPVSQSPWDMDSGSFGAGLNQVQQEELMQSLETDGMEDIQSIIASTLATISNLNRPTTG